MVLFDLITNMTISATSISRLSLFLFFLLGYDGVLQLQASHQVYKNLQTYESNATPTSQPYRTAYHFQPPRNWINDPTGAMIYKGIYHLFYQYNPKGRVWGNIVWAHSTSTDLINWKAHEPVIYPSQPYDIKGVWSGSVTILTNGNPVMFYTGLDSNENQLQNIAIPENLSDPYLTKWVKIPQNPLISPNKINKINSTSFRDPTTGWLGPDKIWRVTIGSKIGRKGLAILYRSKDFIHWVKAKHLLHSAKKTGMWECVDFFPVSVDGFKALDTSTLGGSNKIKHVLKISLDDTKHDYYTIGTYNISMDKYFPDEDSIEGDSGLRYDYGKFYASKTFFDSATNRRILWGWINESSSVSDDVKKGWAGLQSFPRSLWLDKSGKQLVQWPVVEIEKLRGNQVKFHSKLLEGGTVFEVTGVTPAQADVEISFEIMDFEEVEVLDSSWSNPQHLCSKKGASVKGGLGPFGLMVLASKDLQEYTSVFFRIFKAKNKYIVLMCSDQSRSSLNKNNDKTTYGAFLDVDPIHEKVSLRTLIDHSIVGSFGGGGKACITARVYPTLAIDDKAHLYAFNYGTERVKITSLRAWSMKKAQIN